MKVYIVIRPCDDYGYEVVDVFRDEKAASDLVDNHNQGKEWFDCWEYFEHELH